MKSRRKTCYSETLTPPPPHIDTHSHITENVLVKGKETPVTNEWLQFKCLFWAEGIILRIRIGHSRLTNLYLLRISIVFKKSSKWYNETGWGDTSGILSLYLIMTIKNMYGLWVGIFLNKLKFCKDGNIYGDDRRDSCLSCKSMHLNAT